MKPVLQAAHAAWSASDWVTECERAAALLRGERTRVLATVLDNGPAFVALDEAALADGRVHVPLPPFFNDGQVRHALDAAGVDTLIADPALAERWPQWPWQRATVAGEPVCVATRVVTAPALPAGTVKITFTSGTTGQPKGVCLGADALERIANSLVQALGPLGIERHLSVLPYSVLLENVAGSMAARRQGATLLSLPTRSVGLTGSSRFEPAVFHRALREHGANSVILLPQMLRAWCAWLAHSGQRASPELRFVAVGGAAVGAPLLAQAHALGIPAYEGYGLSEAASVQTLNLPGASRPGSAGRPLPHGQVRIAPDGEIQLRGRLHLGYLGDPTPVPEWWPSGDLGRLDAEGFLHIEGRRKHVLITAFGRNVSPEWVETALTSQPAIAQAVVLGDGQARLQAVLWPAPSPTGAHPDALAAALAEAVARANAALPDYARIGHWVGADLARDIPDGLFTPNGRAVRERVLARYGPALAAQAADHPLPTPSLLQECP
jgi:long-chain acyl-CoA synthetase